VSVFTCKPERCYPGFAKISTANMTISPIATPINDNLVNITIDYTNISEDFCPLKLIFENNVEKMAQNEQIKAYGDGKITLALSQVSGSDDLKISLKQNQLCINASSGNGHLNLYLFSDQFATLFIEEYRPKINNSTTQTRVSYPTEEVNKNNTISKTTNYKQESEKKDSNPENLKYMLVVLSAIIILLILIFFKRKKKLGYRLNKKHYPKLIDDSAAMSRMASDPDTFYPDVDKMLKEKQ
jgi:hypothetical protein